MHQKLDTYMNTFKSDLCLMPQQYSKVFTSSDTSFLH